MADIITQSEASVKDLCDVLFLAYMNANERKINSEPITHIESYLISIRDGKRFENLRFQSI